MIERQKLATSGSIVEIEHAKINTRSRDLCTDSLTINALMGFCSRLCSDYRVGGLYRALLEGVSTPPESTKNAKMAQEIHERSNLPIKTPAS